MRESKRRCAHPRSRAGGRIIDVCRGCHPRAMRQRRLTMRSRMLRSVLAAGLLGAVSTGFVSTGCSAAPKTASGREALDDEVRSALSVAESHDSTLRDFLDRSYGYAVFPSVGKLGEGVGGAYGRGEVFERGQMIGYCDLSQATIGLQLGGQKYTEIIAFQDKAALDNFTHNKFSFSAEAGAVAVNAGAGGHTDL